MGRTQTTPIVRRQERLTSVAVFKQTDLVTQVSFQEGYAVSKPYQVLSPTAPVPAPDDVLEVIVREELARCCSPRSKRRWTSS